MPDAAVIVLAVAIGGLGWVVIGVAAVDPGMFAEIWKDSMRFAAAPVGRRREPSGPGWIRSAAAGRRR